ncbi:hypothetical protein Nepgr_009604 [Nepenthes gracilis]|uniref:RING-type E3 ubiquitin transferase n=1 Tax=Nepenthes gracilis TaxID=150966 RepID=A0AAD3SBM3_NEPGR|nr:hypothetical protein Nepgr_009604 [Nepenthes gracilis]
MAPVRIDDILPFIILIFLLSVLGAILTTYFYCCSCRNVRESAADTVSNHHSLSSPRRIDPSFLRALPVVSHWEVSDLTGKDGGGDYALECAVCLSPFQGHHTVRLLPICKHVFHRRCVDPWLAYHATCPFCRANLAPEAGNGESTPSTFSISSLLEELESQSGASGGGGGDGVRGDGNV